MFPSWILGMLWVGSSLANMSLALCVVYYNVLFVAVELVTLLALRASRRFIKSLSFLPTKRKLWTLREQINNAPSFEAWLAAAQELDEVCGATAWRSENHSEEYDSELIVQSTAILRNCRKHGEMRALMMALRSCVHRGYGGVTRPALFEHSYTGTKLALEAFITEVCVCVDAVASTDSVPLPVKCQFVDQLRIQLGRTALALSGGGALALAHAGVVRTLLSAGLLPRVVSGTSCGAIVAGMMATHTDAELMEKILQPSIVEAHGPGYHFFGPPWQQVHNFLSTGRLVDTEKFGQVIRQFTGGDETFLAAFQRTGRIVNISVVARSHNSASYNLQMNYLTAPHVLVWSAVAASCALPGLMRPVTLYARDDAGVIVPYHIASNIRSIDGSMAVDVPRRELGLMFHVDTLLVSQANPHVVPFLELAKGSMEGTQSLGGRGSRLDANPLSRALQAASLWLLLDVRHRMHLLVGLRLLPRWFGEEAGPLFAQSYTGDVTFVPHQSPLEAWKALTQPSESDMAKLICDGQKATWPHLARVRTLVAVEKTLSACARRLADMSGVVLAGPLPGVRPHGQRHLPGHMVHVTAPAALPPPAMSASAPSYTTASRDSRALTREAAAEAQGAKRAYLSPGDVVVPAGLRRGPARMVRVHSYTAPFLTEEGVSYANADDVLLRVAGNVPRPPTSVGMEEESPSAFEAGSVGASFGYMDKAEGAEPRSVAVCAPPLLRAGWASPLTLNDAVPPPASPTDAPTGMWATMRTLGRMRLLEVSGEGEDEDDVEVDGDTPSPARSGASAYSAQAAEDGRERHSPMPTPVPSPVRAVPSPVRAGAPVEGQGGMPGLAEADLGLLDQEEEEGGGGFLSAAIPTVPVLHRGGGRLSGHAHTLPASLSAPVFQYRDVGLEGAPSSSHGALTPVAVGSARAAGEGGGPRAQKAPRGLLALHPLVPRGLGLPGQEATWAAGSGSGRHGVLTPLPHTSSVFRIGNSPKEGL